MVSLLRLPRATRLWLRRLDRKVRDADLRVRCRVLLKVREGKSLRAAAEELACAPSTACRIVARFQARGEASIFDGRWDNGTRKIDEAALAGICGLLMFSPPHYGFPRPTWTLEVLARVIQQELDLEVSVGHLWKILKQARVRWGQPRPVVACPWKAAKRKARLAFLRRLAADLPRGEVLVHVDEVDIHLNPKIGRDWMLPGTQRLIVTPGQNEKRYLAGAYDPAQKRLVYVEGDQKASWLFLNLLRALLDAYRWARKIHLILDNYIIHKSRIVQAWLAANGVKFQLHFQPPYCPEANKIERLWKDLHDNVTRNHQHPTMAGLMRAVHGYLGNRFHLVRARAHAA